MRNWITALSCVFMISPAIAQLAPYASLPSPLSAYTAVQNSTPNHIFAFRQVGGLVFLKGDLEGSEENFILDTGAPTLILNNPHERTWCSDGQEMMGIGGCTFAREHLVDEFSMGTYKAKPLDAISMDISHLEKVLNQSVKGLLGYEAINEYEIMLNYQQQLVEFIPQGGTTSQQYIEVVDFVPINLRGHFPVVKVKIGDRYFHFGLDSGAESNIINLRHRFRLRKQCTKSKKKKYLQGIDNHKSTVTAAKIHQFEVEGHLFENMDVVFVDISHLNEGYGIKLDGILGYPFLKSHIFSINYIEQYLAFWDYLPKYKKRPMQKEEEIIAGRLFGNK